MKKKTFIALASFALAILIAGSAFATGGETTCTPDNPTTQTAYPNLQFVEPGGSHDTEKTAFCGTQYITVSGEQKQYDVWGTNNGACATAAIAATDANRCDAGSTNLTKIVQTIINTITYVIGIIAVIMIILGGISYATSQGDAAKVKKGKDTILYGIIGLVIAILAYAIINFVLQALS